MDSAKVIAQIRKQIATATVKALNVTADQIMLDLSKNVPIKTGALNQSYAIQQRATISNPFVVIGSNVEYAVYQYPRRSAYKNRKMNPDRLMPPFQENPYRVISNNEVNYSKLQALLTTNFERVFNG